MRRGARTALAAAAATGLLSALALSGRDFHLLAWLAWSPLLFVLRSAGKRRAFTSGLVAGGLQAAVLLHWVPATVRHMGKSLVLGIVIVVLLVVVWAGIVALQSVVASVIWRRRATRADRVVATLAVPAGWVICELAFAIGLRQVPWLCHYVGYTQAGSPVLRQLASIGGVHAVTFVVLAVNVAAVEFAATRRLAVLASAATLLLAASLPAWMEANAAQGTSRFTVAVLQGNMPTWDKLDKAKGEALAQRYLLLSRDADKAGADLVVWTESAVPWPLQAGDDLIEAALATTRRSGASHLVGAPVSSTSHPGAYHNAAVLVQPDGLAGGHYFKTRPLLAAEVPLQLPGSRRALKLHPTRADYVAADATSVIKSRIGLLGVNICNENLYADLVRRQTRMGASVLVNMTNDGWFLSDMPLRQHFVVNIFRAVENGRPVIVASNTGASAVIDHRGRVLAQSRMRATECLISQVRPRTAPTLYTRHGDLPLFCISLVLIVAMAAPFRNRKHTNEEGYDEHTPVETCGTADHSGPRGIPGIRRPKRDPGALPLAQR